MRGRTVSSDNVITENVAATLETLISICDVVAEGTDILNAIIQIATVEYFLLKLNNQLFILVNSILFWIISRPFWYHQGLFVQC